MKVIAELSLKLLYQIKTLFATIFKIMDKINTKFEIIITFVVDTSKMILIVFTIYYLLTYIHQIDFPTSLLIFYILTELVKTNK